MPIPPADFLPSPDHNPRFDSTFSQTGAWRFLNDKDPELTKSIVFYLKHVAYRIVGPDVAHEIGYSDIVMNAIHVGLSKAGSFQGDSEGQLRSWLVGIMKNLHRRYRRDILRRNEVSLDYGASGNQFASEKMISELVDSRSCQPVDEACRKELGTVINEAIAQLPWRLKLVVSMHVYDAIDFRTIAERLGMEKSAVEKRYQRAVSQLRENHQIRTILGLV